MVRNPPPALPEKIEEPGISGASTNWKAGG